MNPEASIPIDADEALSALRRGDPAAAERLVRSQTGRLLAVTRRITGNEEDARDAVQQAFATAFSRLGDFKGRSQLSTWIHRIAANAALGILRKRNRRPERSIEDLLPAFYPDGYRVDPKQAWTGGTRAGGDSQHMEEIVRRRFAELPDSHAEVLYLRDVLGADTTETARVLGIEAGAVKTRLHRARQALRTLLEQDLSS